MSAGSAPRPTLLLLAGVLLIGAGELSFSGVSFDMISERTNNMKSLFWHLEKLGRVRLSEHFYLRQFLYSEIAVAYNVPNLPDNPDLAIETGTHLCETILEPIVAEFGIIVIRSGFRSARLNDFGYRKGLKCASNDRNYAAHIWDHLDHQGRKGASACIVIPAFNDGLTRYKTWDQLSRHLQNTLPCTELKRFKYDNAFNVGWRDSLSICDHTR